METTARLVQVNGRVQGVFFRAWTREQARELGIVGWVRNCPDGTVEAHVEGAEAGVNQMVERMRVGPPAAKVEDLRVLPAKARGFERFEIRD
jgi:acylphosphatase